MEGTSQAAPHVAGAIAVLCEAYPSESTDAITNRLTITGVPVNNTGNGITKPQLDLFIAVSTTIKPTPSPDGINVTPSSYTNTNSFTINWTNPYDLSVLKEHITSLVSTHIEYDAPIPKANPSQCCYCASAQTIYVWLKDVWIIQAMKTAHRLLFSMTI